MGQPTRWGAWLVSDFVVDSDSPQATAELGRALGRRVREGDVILLSGDLGAGKTQLVKGLAASLGVDEPVTSPTFNIMLVYEGDLPLYHVDLYRLDRPEQLEDIDYFGSIEAGGVVVVEWGDRFDEAAPADRLSIRMQIAGDFVRRLEIEPEGPRSTELALELLADARTMSAVHVLEAPS